MDLAIVTTPTLISSELLVSILLVPQCTMTDLIYFGNTISLKRHKTFSIRLSVRLVTGSMFFPTVFASWSLITEKDAWKVRRGSFS